MLTLVPTPIGNLEDISYRTVRTLQEAEILLCEDTRVTKKLLSLLAERLGVSFPDYRFLSLHSHNERAILDELDPSLFRDHACVYVSDAGMPGISDPGYALVRFCQENALAYDLLPGANAALLGIVLSGFDTAHFCFYGFLPHKGKERLGALHEALSQGFPVILYESPHRITKLFEELATHYPEHHVFAAKELTKQHQRFFHSPAEKLPELTREANLKGEWVVVVDQTERSGCDPETIRMLKALNAPKKEIAKVLAHLAGGTPKKWYHSLLEN